MEFTFGGRVIEWRGPAPYYYLPVPDEESADIREVAAMATYGWGVIPVVAQIGDVEVRDLAVPQGRRLPVAVERCRPQATEDHRRRRDHPRDGRPAPARSARPARNLTSPEFATPV